VHFEGVTALDDVTLRVAPTEILGLIGPNGAGKTTLINVLSGFQKPSRGSVMLGDRDITGYSAERRSRSGVVRTFQAVRLFGGLTVFENVQLGAVGIGLRRAAAGVEALAALNLVGLASKANELPNSLPHGEERLVGIARSIATKPSFLLLDEPAAGLTEAEADKLLATLGSLRAGLGIGLLIVEHNMRVIMSVCDRIHALDRGRTLAIGTPQEIQSSRKVLDTYLGTGRGKHGAS
jgi:branched-chain amino acid transport system ATP-binding protein